MVRVLSLLLLMAVAPAAPAPPVSAAMPAERQVILVVGDSLSAGYGLRPGQGWVTLLERRLEREGYGHRVVNASVTGETTDGGLLRLGRALERHRPAVVIIELGGNDGLRGLPVPRVRSNLEQLILQSRAAGARVLLVGIRVPTNYGPRYAESFRAVFPDLAARHQVALVPFLLDEVALREELFQADGIHPNAQAQPLLLAELWPALAPLLAR